MAWMNVMTRDLSMANDKAGTGVGQGSKPKVLTVDDDEMITAFYGAILSSQYEVFFAKSGAEAIDACRTVSPDIILLDVEMPEMNGYETCQRLREFTDVPIVFATAHTNLEEQLKAFDAGGDDILNKPLEPAILMRKVALAIKIKHTQEKLAEEKVSLQSQANEFLTSINASRVLLEFVRASLTCRSFEELVKNTVNAIRGFSHEGSIVISHDGNNTYWATHGEATTLEISILEKSRTMGKFFQFKRNLVVNVEHISIVIPNMPVDEESAVRVRENIVLLAETAKEFCDNVDMRKVSMERAESMQIALFEATKAVDNVRHKQVQMLMDVRVLLHGLTDKVERSYSVLDTTKEQERTISGAMNDSVQLILDKLDIGNQVNEQLALVVNSLGGGEKQGDIDLF